MSLDIEAIRKRILDRIDDTPTKRGAIEAVKQELEPLLESYRRMEAVIKTAKDVIYWYEEETQRDHYGDDEACEDLLDVERAYEAACDDLVRVAS